MRMSPLHSLRTRRTFLRNGLWILGAPTILRAQIGVSPLGLFGGIGAQTLPASGGGGTGLKTNLLGYWKLDETSGNRSDSNGSLTWTDYNSVGYDPDGALNNCASFIKSSSQRFSSTDTSFNLGSDTALTISLWIDLLDTGTSPIINKLELSSPTYVEYQLQYSGSSDRYRFTVGNGSSGASVEANNYGVGNPGTFVHLCAWHDPVNNQLGISVNNNSETPTSWSGGTQNRNRTFYVGYNEDTGGFANCFLDEVAIWKDRVLSSSDRTLIYNSGSPLPYGSW